MNKQFLLLCLSVFTFSLCFGQNPVPSLSGTSPAACVDHHNNLHLIYTIPGKSLEYAVYPDFVSQSSSASFRLREGPCDNPQIAVDVFNNVWSVWEESTSEGCHIWFSEIKDGIAFSPTNISRERLGMNRSPDFTFDEEQHPWITWIHRSSLQNGIIVKNLSSDRSWSFPSQKNASLHQPQIIGHHSGQIWLIWVEIQKGTYTLLVSRFDGQDWDTPIQLNRPSPFPQIFSVNRSGLLRFSLDHVVWV